VKKKIKKVLAIRKRSCFNGRMKNKVTFAQILASVRKTGGRPSSVFVPKTSKVKADRNAWKREQE
jgi:hypothetical protein